MAETLKRELGVEAELVEGKRGEFTVLVNDKAVAKKRWLMIPKDEAIVASVKQVLEQ
ncbi:MAG: hypothetical protein H0V88_00990 [Pyrinomonadaceae bacterium]|nr:hypothetical protein [Pyrinomonadaceae bacterium]